MSFIKIYLITRLLHLSKIAYIFYGLGALTLLISIGYTSIIPIGFLFIIVGGIAHICAVGTNKEIVVIILIPIISKIIENKTINNETNEWNNLLKDLVRSLIKSEDKATNIVKDHLEGNKNV